MIKNICATYFSPTGKTAAVATRIAESMGNALSLPVTHDPFTVPGERTHTRSFSPEDLVVFATPTYAGRVPNKALPFVQELFQGNGASAIAVVTFGNRSYDNALKELVHELTEHGFHVIGAAAVVCGHSFAGIGMGRPDDADREKLDALVEALAKKIKDAQGTLPTIAGVPGDEQPWAYYQPTGVNGEKTVFLKALPVVDETRCDRCGACAARCPVGSIPYEAPDTTTGICIKCHACVHFCPQDARSFCDPAFLSHKSMLETTYARPAVTEVFL